MLGFHGLSATTCEAFEMTMPPADTATRMMVLQKARITTVIQLTQENAMVLSMQQRVGGKEIEVMVVERAADLAVQLGEAAPDPGTAESELESLRLLLARHVQAVSCMEQTLKDLDGEIAALRQS
jgi:hypothetical protein